MDVRQHAECDQGVESRISLQGDVRGGVLDVAPRDGVTGEAVLLDARPAPLDSIGVDVEAGEVEPGSREKRDRVAVANADLEHAAGRQVRQGGQDRLEGEMVGRVPLLEAGKGVVGRLSVRLSLLADAVIHGVLSLRSREPYR